MCDYLDVCVITIVYYNQPINSAALPQKLRVNPCGKIAFTNVLAYLFYYYIASLRVVENNLADSKQLILAFYSAFLSSF
jgi:hypothetical protein